MQIVKMQLFAVNVADPWRFAPTATQVQIHLNTQQMQTTQCVQQNHSCLRVKMYFVHINIYVDTGIHRYMYMCIYATCHFYKTPIARCIQTYTLAYVWATTQPPGLSVAPRLPAPSRSLPALENSNKHLTDVNHWYLYDCCCFGFIFFSLMC